MFDNHFLVFEKFVKSLWILKWKTCTNPVQSRSVYILTCMPTMAAVCYSTYVPSMHSFEPCLLSFCSRQLILIITYISLILRLILWLDWLIDWGLISSVRIQSPSVVKHDKWKWTLSVFWQSMIVVCSSWVSHLVLYNNYLLDMHWKPVVLFAVDTTVCVCACVRASVHTRVCVFEVLQFYSVLSESLIIPLSFNFEVISSLCKRWSKGTYVINIFCSVQ